MALVSGGRSDNAGAASDERAAEDRETTGDDTEENEEADGVDEGAGAVAEHPVSNTIAAPEMRNPVAVREVCMLCT